MSREWKPGSVVRLSPDDDRTDWTLRSAIGVVVDEPGRGRKWLHWFYCDGRDAGEHGSLVEPSLVRPLVVIDPEDREAVERLADVIAKSGVHRGRVAKSAETNGLQAALREYANPKTPKPDEPQGLGAVVEDEDGSILTRISTMGRRDWVTAYGTPFAWADIAAVRVLSAGVEVSA